MTDDAAHIVLISSFYGMPWDAPELPSMAFMTYNEAAHYLRFVLHAAEVGLPGSTEDRGFLIEPPIDLTLIFNEDRSAPSNEPKGKRKDTA